MKKNGTLAKTAESYRIRSELFHDEHIAYTVRMIEARDALRAALKEVS